jgi:Tfp pilus assembly protein FimT
LKFKFQKTNRAFSLVELLLTLVLLLCLAAASVFSYTAIHRGANLDEGVNRLQSLIRFAQAEAATSGRKVRLQFETGAKPSGSDEGETELRQIKVTWEADFMNAPGVFQEYTNKTWSEDMVNDLVGVAKVEPIQNSNAESTPVLSASNATDITGQTNEDFLAGEWSAETFPPITFYPDGSCDSAEIVLASRNSEDDRRLAVRLSGILGSISSHPVSSTDNEDFDDSKLSDDENSSIDTMAGEEPEQDFAQSE